ncbi:MAG TPA: vitamin K epoxide reductase family protein, partial [Pirellulales bacterium]
MTAPPSPAVVWTIRLLALAAGGTATYLWYVSEIEKSLPIGCGADSGCAAVLASRWSSVGGISVAALALLLDAALFLASFGLTSRSETTRRAAAVVLTIGGWALIGAAIWFVGLQQIVLGALCP